MPISTYLANKLLDHQVGKTAFTMPVVHVGLSSTTPAASGSGVTEPSAGGYARVATTGATWQAAVAGISANVAAITFPKATADWSGGSNMTFGVLYDAATGGNLLGYAPLAVARNVLSGDTPFIDVNGLNITLS